MELTLADEVYLARFDLTTGLTAHRPRWDATAPSPVRAPQAAALVELIAAGHATAVATHTTDPRKALMGMDDSRPEISVTALTPTDPLLISVWEQLSDAGAPRTVRKTLLAIRIDMEERLMGLGVLDRQVARPGALFLTVDGMTAARASRAELNAWVARNDVAIPAADRVMIARATEPSSPLSPRSRLLAALVTAGDLWAQMWPDREISSKAQGMLSIARDEALYEGIAALPAILQELRLLNAPSA
ncbi:GPP34 family phosphoprotein [Glaciihabitans sp. dw_435]|uniref:GPP34 family phosphoprotein n=1 Tax=Glaciihabitans sp. dw_435 TaxID=2720081 RepID=UPI001BD691B2|nr:GPP34 family phosphoprotein [Glaciihabitans sp. dw_435]